MKKIIALFLVLMCLLTACTPTKSQQKNNKKTTEKSQESTSAETNESTESGAAENSTASHTDVTIPNVTEATVPYATEATIPDATEDITPDPTEDTTPVNTEPMPPQLPMDLPVEDVIRYFNEVCLDAEFSNAGDATLLQKWAAPIVYRIYGEPTAEDLEVLTDFTQWLNDIEGFPGISPVQDGQTENLSIHFCTQQALLDILGTQFAGTDGGVTFWYNGNNEIYKGTICYRTDIDQEVRNSVILEEIYNGLGPVQDTALRPDSIIYSGYSIPQALTEIDELLLQLLYHPSLTCGMNAARCEAAIRQLWQAA